MRNLVEVAKRFMQAGLVVFPVTSNKRPALGKGASWLPSKTPITSIDVLKKYFKNAWGIAVAGGAASGNLEFIDFDLQADALSEWISLVEEEVPGLTKRIYIEKSPHGVHIAYRCPRAMIDGNDELALREIDNVPKALIETRGEGGYCVVAPSPGYTSESSIDLVPTVSPEEREVMLRLARSLNEYIRPQDIIRGYNQPKGNEPMRPGDDFDQRGDIRPYLLEHKWIEIGKVGHTKQGGEASYWRRHGTLKERSASLIDGKLLWVFSTGTKFTPNKLYPPFAAYAILEHNGDFSAAAKALAAQGYGEQRNQDNTQNAQYEFGEPVNVFANSLIGTPELDKEWIPNVVSRYAQDTAERMGVSFEMVAIPALGVASGVIDDGFKIQPRQHDYTWKEHPKLWIGAIAESGQKKTPVLKEVTHGLIRVEKEFHEANELRKAENRKRTREYEAALKRGEQVEQPDLLPMEQKVVDDITIEALRKPLVDNPGGLLILKDELATWFNSFGAYKSGEKSGHDRAKYLELYNGGPQKVNRVKDDGDWWVPNWSAAILGGIQPGPMKRFAGKINDDGLIQRFLVFYASGSTVGIDRTPDAAARDAFHDTIAVLARMKAPEGGVTIKFTPEADTYVREIESLSESLRLLPEVGQAMGEHLSKFPGFFARLSLVLHMIQNATQREVPTMVSVETAEMAFQLLISFFLGHAAKFYGEILRNNNRKSETEWIAGYILSRSLNSITARDIKKAYRAVEDANNDEIASIMNRLVLMNWVTPGIGQQGGLLWKVNPQVHVAYKGRAEVERRERQAEMEKIAKAVAHIKSIQKEVTTDEN